MTVQKLAGIDRARDAAARGAWSEAFSAFEALDAAGLSSEDLETYADATWWLGRIRDSMAIRQKAYAGYLASGAITRAAHTAWFLYYDYMIRGEPSVASGWLKRAQRHLESETECLEHGFLALAEAGIALDRGDFEEALEHADRVVMVGERFAARDVVAMGIDAKGRILIAGGEIRRGTELLDEAMAAVLVGEVSPFFTGWIYCNVLAACMKMADFRRAVEWNEAAQAWCDSIRVDSPFHGICRIHRVELAALRGAWAEAESEALRTSEDFTEVGPWIASEAFYLIGEIQRRRGDLNAAEEAFTRAHASGHDPQPGLALIRLAQGKIDAAAAGLRTALTAHGDTDLQRARLLAAQVEVSLAAGDTRSAGSAVEELSSLRDATSSSLIDAMVATATGALHLAGVEIEQALECTVRAVRLWQDLKLPYEAAQARILVAEASRRSGDEERARLELDAARAAFERLGAKLDARRAADLLGQTSELPAGLSAREIEVLRLVAAGKTNREIAAEMVISEHTVSRHLQNIFAKLGVSTRAGATAFAYENQLV